MAIQTKVFLILGVILMIAGTIMSWGPYSHQVPPSLHVVFPVGTIFLGLFLISKLFEKEDKIYGEDQKRATAKGGEPVKTPPAERL
jgi:membrane-bound ClpP family serine protease